MKAPSLPSLSWQEGLDELLPDVDNTISFANKEAPRTFTLFAAWCYEMIRLATQIEPVCLLGLGECSYAFLAI